MATTKHTGVTIVRPSISHDIWASHPDSQASHRDWARVNEISGNYPISVLYPDDTVSTYTWKFGLHVLEVLVTNNHWSIPVEEMYNINAVIKRNDAYWRNVALTVPMGDTISEEHTGYVAPRNMVFDETDFFPYIPTFNNDPWFHPTYDSMSECSDY